MGEVNEKDGENEEPEGAKARLFGMVVREVSLVDRAANQRTFLVTKRDPMPGKTNVTKGPEQGTAENAAAAAGTPPGGSSPDGAGAPTQGGQGAAAGTKEKLPPMQPQVKDQLMAALSSIAEEIVDLADQVKAADSDEKATGPAVPESVVTAIGAVSQKLSALLAQYGGQPAGDGKTKADLDGVSENGGVTAQGSQKSADEKKKDAEEMAKALAAYVAKAGRKMAKERLQRLNAAISSLSQIARELKTEKVRKNAGAVHVADRAIARELAEVSATLEELTKSSESIVADNAKLRSELAEMAKRVGPRNANPTEAPSGTAPARGVSWPIDLNNPIRAKSDRTDFAGARR